MRLRGNSGLNLISEKLIAQKIFPPTNEQQLTLSFIQGSVWCGFPLLSMYFGITQFIHDFFLQLMRFTISLNYSPESLNHLPLQH